MLNVSESDDKYYTKIFIILSLLWVLVWSAIPIIFFEGTYVDFIENAALARRLAFGYDKHPYFGIWVNGFVNFLGGVNFSYIFAQLLSLVCIILIWKIARLAFSAQEALVAVIILIATPAFSFMSHQLNQNVVLMALWLLVIFFFYKALLYQKIYSWFFVGIFCGLGLMTKYFCVFLFVPMAFIVFFIKEGRNSFSRLGIYLCFLVFFIIVTPNIFWLFDNEFFTFVYSSKKAQFSISVSFFHHILRSLEVVGLVFVNFLFSIIIFLICFIRKGSLTCSLGMDFYKKYINLMFWGPVLLIMLFSLIEGVKVIEEWLHPVYSLFAILPIIYWRPCIITRQIMKLYLKLLSVLVIIAFIGEMIVILYFYPYKSNSLTTFATPTYPIANDITNDWHRQFNTPLKYVVGTMKYSAILSIFGEDHPEAIFMNPDYRNLYFEYKEDINRNGAVLVWDDREIPEWLYNFKDYYSGNYTTKTYERAVKPYIKRLIKYLTGEEPKTFEISFAFIEQGRAER